MSYDTRYMTATSRAGLGTTSAGWLTLIVVVVLAALRLCHVHLLWADEDYHLAAAIDLVHGKAPYRDFWYDKPPLSAFYYLLIGGHWGWPLRLLDAGYILVACYLIYLLALQWWGYKEGRLAAILLAFFTVFYLPSAVIPFAADAIMLVPHLGAIYCAFRGWPWRAGLFAGVGFLANTKAVFVLATCAIWLWPAVVPLAVGFTVPVAAAAAIALPLGILKPYYEQVWHWGLLYAKGSPVEHPIRNGIVRTADWLGFHAFLAAFGWYGFLKSTRREYWRLGAWLLLSFAGTALGSRFAPHYFLQFLPPCVLCASRGAVLLQRRYGRRAIAMSAVLLAVPVVRFGPHYATLLADNVAGRNPKWSDVAMDLDSQKAAAIIRRFARPSDTLFVWGYRPDIYVYTRLVPDGRFEDSQPLTGVPADRHLSSENGIYDERAAADRREFVTSQPRFFVDGLSPLNPRLAPDRYPELRSWLTHYRLVGRTALTLVYRRND